MTREFQFFILVNCIVIILSMIKIICLKIIFPNVIKSKVKRILISFNCFSEYIFTKKQDSLGLELQCILKVKEYLSYICKY